MVLTALQVGLALAFILCRPAYSETLKDIEHVVIFMQENRAFNNVGIVAPMPSTRASILIWLVFWFNGRRSWFQRSKCPSE